MCSLVCPKNEIRRKGDVCGVLFLENGNQRFTPPRKSVVSDLNQGEQLNDRVQKENVKK